MQSDEELQTTLSKWPFILGDVLLVATALAIAILGHWQLTNWQVASCVVSVALGCGLFVLPYIVEYQVRVREQTEDRAADLRILRRHLVAAGEELEEVGTRIKSLELGLTDLAQAKPDLTAPLQALEGKFEPLQSQQAAQSSQLDSLAQRIDTLAQSLQPVEAKLEPLQGQQAKQSTQLDALVQQVETLAQSLQANSDAETIQALRSELAVLQAQVGAISAQVIVPAASDGANEAPEIEVELEVTTPEEPKAKKIRSSRTRRSSEPRLLKRAIEQKQDRSSQAVSRIIESKSGVPESSAAEISHSEPSKVEEASVVSALEAEPESIPETESEPAVAEPVLVVEAEPEAKELEEVKESAVEQPELEVEATELEVEDAEVAPESNTLTESGDLFGDAIVVEAKKRKRTKKGDTAVIASVFIGIGNKPFVRGSGPSLNWDTGIAMEFEEIGKWRWSASADLEAPIEIQLFRNDEDPDTTGKYILEPGQQLDLSPVF